MMISTDRAVFIWPSPSSSRPRPVVGVEGAKVTAAAEQDDVRVVALEDRLIVCAHDSERTLEFEMGEPPTALLILAGVPLRLLVGTQDARLYRFDVASGAAQRIEAFDRLACRNKWHTPWGGPPAVRSLAACGGTVYADIHVGSIMRSEDEGEAWEPVAPTLHEDVHQVATCPAAPNHVVANTADAVYVSVDRGRSWSHRGSGLDARYGRAVAVHPRDPACLLATVSDGPHGGNGRLVRSLDGGNRWTHVTDGFPKSSERNIDTFQIAFDSQGGAWAAVESDLYSSRDRGCRWAVAWQAPAPIRRIACG